MGNKGTPYEREICKQLSLWWTDNERDDIFWRTGGSGGRARTRSKRGRRTEGQHGDIAASDPSGAALIRLLTIEIKRGYSKFTAFDVIDKPRHAAKQQWERWVGQIITAHEEAGSYSWLLIHKRDRRDAVVFIPFDLYSIFFKTQSPVPRARFKGKTLDVCCLKLRTFLDHVTPDLIRSLDAIQDSD